MAKIKTHVILVASRFPKNHFRSNEPTRFRYQIIEGLKKHTIRGSYDRWKKKIDEVNAGQAILSIRAWTGAPYKSKQEVIKDLSGPLNIQRIQYDPLKKSWIVDVKTSIDTKSLSKADGLSLVDFESWFDFEGKGIPTEEQALIWFSDSKY